MFHTDLIIYRYSFTTSPRNYFLSSDGRGATRFNGDQATLENVFGVDVVNSMERASTEKNELRRVPVTIGQYAIFTTKCRYVFTITYTALRQLAHQEIHHHYKPKYFIVNFYYSIFLPLIYSCDRFACIFLSYSFAVRSLSADNQPTRFR